MTTTVASTHSSTLRPVSTPLPRPPRYTASRKSHSQCQVTPSGSGSRSSPPLETLWWWVLSTPALSDEHMLTKTHRHTHTSCFFRISGPQSETKFVDRNTYSFFMYLSPLSLFLSLPRTWLLDQFGPIRMLKL